MEESELRWLADELRPRFVSSLLVRTWVRTLT